MKKPLPARIDRLEAARDPLPLPWQVELAQLEADYATRFPMPFSSWSSELCDAFLAYHASDTAGHLDELRERAKSPQQRADDAAAVAKIKAMNRDELDAYLAARCADPEEPPSERTREGC